MKTKKSQTQQKTFGIFFLLNYSNNFAYCEELDDLGSLGNPVNPELDTALFHTGD